MIDFSPSRYGPSYRTPRFAASVSLEINYSFGQSSTTPGVVSLVLIMESAYRNRMSPPCRKRPVSGIRMPTSPSFSSSRSLWVLLFRASLDKGRHPDDTAGACYGRVPQSRDLSTIVESEP